VTHEYVIGLGGLIAADPTGDGTPTAIAWAADRILAIGPDARVRAISRGDSVFLDLAGCSVTPLPGDTARAVRVLGERGVSATDPRAIVDALADAGLLDPGQGLEPGSAADLACWSGDPVRLLATVIGGAFTEHDEHLGPFRPARGYPA
jgi:hypothetical protein